MSNFVQKLKQLKWWQWLLLGLGIFLIVGWIIGANFGRTKYGRFVIIDDPVSSTFRQVVDSSDANSSIFQPVLETNTGAAIIKNWRMENGKELLYILYEGSSHLFPQLTIFNPKTKQFSNLEFDKFDIPNYYGKEGVIFTDDKLIQVGHSGVRSLNVITGEASHFRLSSLDTMPSHYPYVPADEIFEETDIGEEKRIDDVDVIIGPNVQPFIIALPDDKIIIVAHNGLRGGNEAINEYIFDFKTEEFSKVEPLIGLPGVGRSVTQLDLGNYLILCVDTFNKAISLFDGNKQRVIREWKLEGNISSSKSTMSESGISIQRISDNLVWVGPKVISGNAIGGYVLNFRTGSKTYRSIPPTDLIQGQFDYRQTLVSTPTGDQVFRGNIEREDDSSIDFKEITKDKSKTFFLSFTDKNNILLTGYDYKNIPWSFGVYNIKNNRKIPAGNPSSVNTDPATNYGDTIGRGNVQHSIALADGSVLFVGPLWFVYENPTSNIFTRAISFFFHSIEHPITKAYLVWYELFRVSLLGVFLYLLSQGKFQQPRLTKPRKKV